MKHFQTVTTLLYISKLQILKKIIFCISLFFIPQIRFWYEIKDYLCP